MPEGPGKYDAECSTILDRTKAGGVILIVVEGDRGTGVSIKASEDIIRDIPAMLHTIAVKMEAEVGVKES